MAGRYRLHTDGGPTPSNSPPPAVVGLRPGDAIKVEIWQEPDLSGEYMVNTEGVAVFPLLGERRVTGISAAVLERQLVADYKEYLENPSVNVTVLRRISILGVVRKPGLYPVDPTFTLTDALALAGGISPMGNQKDIRLVRSGRVIQRSLDGAVMVGSLSIGSGDQIVVGQRSWLSQNTGVVAGGIGTIATVLAIILTNN